MIAAAVTWVAAQLADPTTGLNATLARVAFPMPDIEAPTVRVIGAFEAAWAARGDMPLEEVQAGPVLVVRPAGEIEMAFQGEDAGVPPNAVLVALHYGARGSKSHVEFLVAEAVLRTAQRVLRALFATGPEAEYAVAGGFIQRPSRVTYLPPFDEDDKSVVSVACVLPFPVHDAWALGAP